MDPSLDKDESANQFMEIDVVVKRQDRGQTQVSEHGDAVSEDKNEDKDRIEEENSATGSGEKIEWVGSESPKGSKVSEVDSSVDEQGDVDNDDHKEEADKGKVVLNVSPAHEWWNLFTKFVLQ